MSEFESGGGPIHPFKYSNAHRGEYYETVGLTKREYFAIMIMQSIYQTDGCSLRKSAENAVYGADYLINELSK